MAIAIVVVLNLFFNYAIHLAYPAPQWDKFCPIKQVNIMPETKEACLAEGGSWTENNGEIITPESEEFDPGATRGRVAPRKVSYCNVNFTCDQEFSSYQATYNRNVFLILVAAGIVSLLVGLLATLTAPVSLGLTLGGVLSLIIGSIRYWSGMQDYLRVILLGVALVVLIWLGIKKFRE